MSPAHARVADHNPIEVTDPAGYCNGAPVGFYVEATDGGIGKVDEATHDVGGA